ncbi:MAG: TIGR03086 family metal-binding protein, partial [Stackebrandtia sp.]
MSETQHAARAAETFADVVADVKPDQLSAQTPCAEYDVRKLVNHLLFWGPVLEAAARKETVAPRAEAEADVDLTQGDWAGALQAQARRVAAAWSRPEAWRGATRMGGPDEMPAPLIGGMVVVELVVHGWDLA